MKRNEYDVIVVGGGITGAGTARDCAMRGLRVLLIERHDIATGATVPITLPATQNYRVVDGHQRVDAPMGAYTEGSTLQFSTSASSCMWWSTTTQAAI